MTCYHPNNAHVSGQRASGTKIISFGLPKMSDQEPFLLPCGQCIGCRLDHSIMWAARCMHENQMHEDSCFLTLTYDDEHLPHDGSITPPHFTNFMKRLRHHVEPKQIRFYHGAEYGDLYRRPHHHVLIFGYKFDDIEIFRECEGLYTYYSPSLEKIWGKGFCTQAEVTLESAAYVARYCLKKINGKQKDEHYTTTDPITGEINHLQPEYATMSRKPGIAKEWYEKFSGDIFPYDNCHIRGKPVKTPRYYENILRSTDQDAFETLKQRRKEKAFRQLENNTPARLKVREQHKILTMQQSTRRTLDNET